MATAVKVLWGILRANPLGLLITAAMLIYEYWGPISDFFSNLWNDITGSLPDFGAWAAGAVRSMRELFGKGIQWIKDKIAGLVEFLPDWVKEKMGLKPGGGGDKDSSGGGGSDDADFDRAINNALAASQAASNPALIVPGPAQAASMDNSVRQDVKLDAKTDINVYTTDSVAAGNQAADRQSQVNADLVRHAKGAAR